MKLSIRCEALTRGGIASEGGDTLFVSFDVPVSRWIADALAEDPQDSDLFEDVIDPMLDKAGEALCDLIDLDFVRVAFASVSEDGVSDDELLRGKSEKGGEG